MSDQTIRAALAELLEWFRPAPGALTASELLIPGCPGELAATLARCRRAVGEVDHGPDCPTCPLDDDGRPACPPADAE